MNKNRKTCEELVSKKVNSFVKVNKKIVSDVDTFSKNELLAYVVMSSFADNNNGMAFPSLSTIAKYMRASKETARNAINGLLEKGVLIYEQRVDPENPKENTSNLYTLIKEKDWEDTKKKNKIVLKARKEKYIKQLGLDKKKEKDIKKVASEKITNNNKQKFKKLNDIVSFEDMTSQEFFEKKMENVMEEKSTRENKEKYTSDETYYVSNEINQKTHSNIRLLKSSGIKFIPNHQEKEIENMDTDVLKKAIEVTIEKATFPNWKYLSSVYESFKDKVLEVKDKVGNFIRESKPNKFANFDQNFMDYSEEEFDRIVAKSQKEKFGKALCW